MHGLVDDGTIAAVLGRKSLRRAARGLVRAAKRAGGTDNITVIVAQMDAEVQVVHTHSVADSLRETLPPR